jgi:hypothetical protein
LASSLPVVSPSVCAKMSDHSPEYDVEKKATGSGEVATEDVVHGAGGEHMHRSLKARQVSMIAIAGTIGTGCTFHFFFLFPAVHFCPQCFWVYVSTPNHSVFF